MLDINQLVEENVSFIRRMVEETVEIKLDLASDLPNVKSDQGQLTQVIMNFAINGRDAMDGKGVLTIKTERIPSDSELVAQNPVPGIKEYILLSVSDTGCGIAPDEMDRIFTPYFTTKIKGSGLGLAISQKIIEDHNGLLKIESTRCEGTTITVSLPLRR